MKCAVALASFTLLACCGPTANAQNAAAKGPGAADERLIGTWTGNMKADGKDIRIAMTFQFVTDHLLATMKLSDNREAPFKNLINAGDRLLFDVGDEPGTAHFSGQIAEDIRTLSGKFYQTYPDGTKLEGSWTAAREGGAAKVSTSNLYADALSSFDFHLYDRAIPVLNQCLAANSKSEECLLLRGRAYRASSSREPALINARNDFSAVIAINPANAEAYGLRGRVAIDLALRTLNTFQRAFDGLSKATAPTQAELDLISQGIADLDKMVALRPADYRGFRERALANAALFDVLDKNPSYAEKALEDFATAMKMNPKAADLWQGRARVYQKQGKADLAAADREHAKGLAPTP